MQVCFKKYRCLPENLENKETYAWGRSDISFFSFLFQRKRELFVPIFCTCAVLLSFLDEGVGVVIRSVHIYDLVKTAF